MSGCIKLATMIFMNKKENKTNEEEFGIKAKKSLGQNFLNSDGALDAIIKAGRVVKGDTVLEIGPGKGALTKRLLSAGANVVAIEKDDRLIPVLEELFAKEIKSKQLTLIHGDVLKFDVKSYLSQVKSYKLIANIPYYITGEITRKFLSGNFQPSLIVVLVQKEVAERITTAIQGSSKIKEGKESILSISVKAYGEPKYIQTVKAGCFFPPPKVDSAILLIDNISKDRFKFKNSKTKYKLGSPGVPEDDNTGEMEEKFFEIVKKGFAHKRKTLSSNLKGIVSKEILAEQGINENERAENLTLEQWFNITNNL
jgi:16S rRNA (adenine1518-N6/adenine1519-N6)-dimethyltransferase